MIKKHLLTCFAVFCTLCTSANNIVLWVNQVPVYRYELLREMKRHRTMVITEVLQDNRMEMTAEFWNTPVKGKTPLQLLQKKAIKSVTEYKITEELLAANSLWAYYDSSSFTQNLNRINQERKWAVQSGKVVFGPIEFSELDLYDYWITNNIEKLKSLLMNQRLKPGKSVLGKHLNQFQDDAKTKSIEALYHFCLKKAYAAANIKLNEEVIKTCFVQ